MSLLSDKSVIQLLDEIIRSDSDPVDGGGTKAIEDQISKVNGGGEGDAKGHRTNKQEVNAVAETLPQCDGNANGQEQTGVTDDGQLCVMEDGGSVEGEGTKAIEDQIFKVNGCGEGDMKGHGTNKQEVNAVAETLPQCDGNTNGQEQTVAGPGFLPLHPIWGRYCKQGSCPKCLPSQDSIPQCLLYWWDGVSAGTDTRSYEYFSLCYDNPAPGQR